MKRIQSCIHVICSLFAVVSLLASSKAEEEIRFSRDVLPLLSDRCFHCHGPDVSHREANLRLDFRDSAVSVENGLAAVVPHKPESSEMLSRISSDSPDLKMPPPGSGRKSLSQDEIEILRRWIAEGAQWGNHWAFEKPVRPQLPASEQHPIDAILRRRLERERLQASPPADRRTLIRRVSFDLTGLPPEPSQVEAFVRDESPDAYARLVDRLLQSEHYGERMAMWWLDAARYSDTDGFQQDATRSNWPWRDWVIQAFKDNMPFDQFTIEQFAGDLLPDATPQQRLATCFHRNHMTNGEGGRDPEESRIDYVIDRVNTTGTVWLGLTLGCCQCHSHKFDPISHEEYYGLFAFFNSIDEDGKAGTAAKPYLKFKSSHTDRAIEEAKYVVESRVPKANAGLKSAEQDFELWLAEQTRTVLQGVQSWHPLKATSLASAEGTILEQESNGTIQAKGPNPKQDDYRIVASPKLVRITGLRLEIFPHESHTDGKLSRGRSGEFILTDVKLQVRRRGKSELRDIDIVSAIADAEKNVKNREYGLVKDTLDDDPRNGWTTESHDPKTVHTAIFELDVPLYLNDDEEILFVLLHRSTEGDANTGRFRVSATDQRGPAIRSLALMPLEELANSVREQATLNDQSTQKPPFVLSEKLRKRLLEQFLTDHLPYQRVKSELERANRQLAEITKSAGEVNVMVLAERKEALRTFVLERGVWDKKGAEVHRSFPSAVLKQSRSEILSRLDLAHWLVDGENPLPARVMVNHLWQICFGKGLVRTPEDFGLQGELPTHPELLDWLAVEFVESKWDIQHLLRTIVSSQTYQQSSRVNPELLQRDPDNRLLARSPRFRLPSWMIRDSALKLSGLLNPSLGGPPVMPYQPEGVWAELFMGRLGYEPSQGPAQHRRTLYAFWRRSAAPTFLFDSAQRRSCEVRTLQTNTPLHALTILNDQSILESARELARIALNHDSGTEGRLKFLFRSTLSRPPTETELKILTHEWSRAWNQYSSEPVLAERLLDFGQPEQRDSIGQEHRVEVAALMIVASLILNLDEAITHE
jgi:hypothetical protein